MTHHPDLAAVMTAAIPASAKLLYSAMYARTNGALTGAVPVAELCRELDGLSEKTLRNLRTILAPWAITATDRGILLFWLTTAANEVPQNPAPRDETPAGRDSTAASPTDSPEPLPPNPAPRDKTPAGRDSTEAAPPTPPYEEEELINLPEINNTPPPLTPPTATAPDAAEQKRTYALLTDPAIAMSWAKARECQARPFAHCLAHVLAWQTESTALARSGAQKQFTAGLLAHRIAKFPTPALAWEYSQLDLLRRHAPELLAQPDDPSDLSDPPDPSDPSPPQWLCTTPVPCAGGAREAHEIWTQTVSQLRLQMTQSTWETWLRDTRCQEYGGGGFVIAVPTTYAKDWLSLRLRPTIKRTLSSIVGHTADVTFEVVS